MDELAIRALARLDNDFYRENGASFSATRVRGWDGWNRVLGHMRAGEDGFRVLDVACGNLRFERFVEAELPGSHISFTCIDSCEELVGGSADTVRFERVDVIDRLLASHALADGGYDMAVSFGFIHHVPTFEIRVVLLRELLGQVREGGIVAVSFWKFAEDDRLAARARKTTAEGCARLGIELEKGDYLVGWNARPDTYRYCHSFSDAEIESLLDAIASRASVVDRFAADGRNGAMNGYAVLRRR